MENKLVFVVFIGLPGSGKSTVCRHMQIQTPGSYIHICYDNLQTRVQYGTDDTVTWKNERTAILVAIKKCCLKFAGRDCVADHESESQCDYEIGRKIDELFKDIDAQNNQRIAVLIDDNMFYTSMRYTIYQLCRELQCGYCQIYMNTPMDTCIENNLRRQGSEKIPEEVMNRMNCKLEPPDATKNDWESSTVVIEQGQNMQDAYTRIETMIQKCFDNPAVPCPVKDEALLQLARQQTQHNTLHQLDLKLRKAISQILSGKTHQNFSKTELKNLQPKLLEAKKTLLEQFKDGGIEISDLEDNKLEDLLLVCVKIKKFYMKVA